MNYQLKNVLGSIYRKGNVAFSPDNNYLYSPVGNRVFCYDLLNNTSFTFPFELHKNVNNICTSPNGKWMILCDEDGRAVLVTTIGRSIIHEMSFKSPVSSLSFSPCGQYLAVGVESKYNIQVWKLFKDGSNSNAVVKEFNMFTLLKTITGHHDKVTSISWSPDGKHLLSSSKDMSVRISPVFANEEDDEPIRSYRICGHRDAIVGAHFSHDMTMIYSVSRDGVCYLWKRDLEVEDEFKYHLLEKHFFSQQAALGPVRVKSVKYHAKSQLLVVGFANGVFGLWDMPSFSLIHTLSVSQSDIDALEVSASGEWLAIGSSQLGQLIVWEWQSETYVLKQQGHAANMKVLSYSPDGQIIATGGNDGKIKLWSINDGFCFATFTEHTGSITGIEFSGKMGGKQGVLFSSSIDGTVRAFDTKRFRHFRTFTAPNPVQLSCLAVDPSGEVVCAGSKDTFEIYVWSVQTGNLLDVFVGHEGPISALCFSSMEASASPNQTYFSSNQLLVSGSWDKSVRVWDLYSRGLKNKCSEVFAHGSEVVAVALRADGKEIASTTMDGKIAVWNLSGENSKQALVEIGGQNDIGIGRRENDSRTAKSAEKSSYFTTICYSADGKRLIAGSTSRWVCNYDIKSKCLLNRMSLSRNYSLDGITDMLNSKYMTEAGPLSTIDDDSGFDYYDRHNPHESQAKKLPIMSSCIKFSPTGDCWAVCTSEGVSIYSRRNNLLFDPVDLDVDLTPESTVAAVKSAQESKENWLVPLVMALRLNEIKLIQYVLEKLPHDEIAFIIEKMPVVYMATLLDTIFHHFEMGADNFSKTSSKHLEHYLLVLKHLLVLHWKDMQHTHSTIPDKMNTSASMSRLLRAVRKSVVGMREDLQNLSSENIDLVNYYLTQIN